jgi:hypothetical protein
LVYKIDIYFVYISQDRMLFWIIQTTFLSILVIFIVHHLVIYFQDNYTVKKTKDLTEIQTQKYKTILDEMQKINEKEKSELLRRNSYENKNNSKIAIEAIQDNSVPILSQRELLTMDEDLNNFIQSIQ